MLGVALAEVWRSPSRTALRALAIGGAVSITLLFEGFRLGMDRQMAGPAASLPATLVAVEEGAKHFLAVRSDLPQSARSAIEAIAGVKSVHPLVSVPVIFAHEGRRTPIQLLAYDSGGAPRLAAGAPIGGPRQVVMDRQLARLHGLHLGDRVEVLDRPLTVVGLSVGTDVSFSPLVFVTYDELIDLYLERNVPGAMGGAPLLSFLLVDLDPTAVLASVRRTIESEVPGVDLYTPAELAAQDVALGRQLFGPVLDLFVAIGWLVVVLTVGLTMYAAVIDRRRELGVMKALGVGPRGLAGTVILEALLVALAAFPVGLVLARGAAAAVQELSPLYRVEAWEPTVVVRGALAAVAAALVGSLVPVRRLAALEPDLVFRS
jgi:putative ABC transport system permease protein